MRGHMHRVFETHAPAATVLVRLLVGVVFLTEGVLKFLLPAELGAGRFARIGIPSPAAMGPFVGAVEIVCGLLVVWGLLTRPAAFALFVNITVAILSTKIPIWLGHGYWHFSLPKVDHYGFLGMLHEARTDLCMWLGCLFLMIVGAGAFSLDAAFSRRHGQS